MGVAQGAWAIGSILPLVRRVLVEKLNCRNVREPRPRNIWGRPELIIHSKLPIIKIRIFILVRHACY